jgi:streptomycin 6-kinase
VIRVPANLRDADSAADGARGDWLASLPALVTALSERWSLEVFDPFEPGGRSAWVAPARQSSGGEVVLKIGWPHPESEQEAAGLSLWDGDGAVRLLASTTVANSPALLLERCRPGTTLAQSVAPDDCDVVVAELLSRLWREPPPGHGFRPLQQMCDEWVAVAERELPATAVADPGVIRAGLALFRALPASAASEVVLLTDLHAENVLAAEREPWLAIDPKPYLGDPCYDVLQYMINVPRLRQDPEGLIRRMADLAGLDADRVRLWTFARCAVLALDDPEFADVAAGLAL